MLAKRVKGSASRWPQRLAAVQMTQQQSFMVRVLPDDLDAFRPGEPCSFLIFLFLPEINKNSFVCEPIPAFFNIGNFLNGARDKRKRITGSRLKDFNADMNMNAGRLPREAPQQSAVGLLTSAFTAEKNRHAGPYYGSSPPHPICGTAP